MEVTGRRRCSQDAEPRHGLIRQNSWCPTWSQHQGSKGPSGCLIDYSEGTECPRSILELLCESVDCSGTLLGIGFRVLSVDGQTEERNQLKINNRGRDSAEHSVWCPHEGKGPLKMSGCIWPKHPFSSVTYSKACSFTSQGIQMGFI